eukprot:100992-Chlamydomonas_euryale.AAC.1
MSAAVHSHCAPLRKLQHVVHLLSASMADLVSAWADGSLAAAGWTRAEAERLLCALFEVSSQIRLGREDGCQQVRRQ